MRKEHFTATNFAVKREPEASEFFAGRMQTTVLKYESGYQCPTCKDVMTIPHGGTCLCHCGYAWTIYGNHLTVEGKPKKT